jgi:hypothetical protein
LNARYLHVVCQRKVVYACLALDFLFGVLFDPTRIWTTVVGIIDAYELTLLPSNAALAPAPVYHVTTVHLPLAG